MGSSDEKRRRREKVQEGIIRKEKERIEAMKSEGGKLGDRLVARWPGEPSLKIHDDLSLSTWPRAERRTRRRRRRTEKKREERFKTAPSREPSP